jgi:L-alanine-DL-glutamate epimerase-like enolase superfamily enzyme
LAYKPHAGGTEFGFAVNLHLMATSDFADEELEYPYAPPAWTIEAPTSLLTEPFHHRNGELDVPTKPGLGLDINWRALRRWSKRTFVMDRKRLLRIGELA